MTRIMGAKAREHASGVTATGKNVTTRVKNKSLVDRRRSQIIKGALKVFTVKGFHASTVREIAEAAGLTMGSLYNYVRSKEDIIFIVYEEVTKSLQEGIRGVISQARTPSTRLRSALHENLKMIHQHQDVIMFLYKESASLDRESLRTVLARETQYIQLFELLLRDYFRSRGETVDETRLRVAADLLTYIPVIVAFRRWSLQRRFQSMDRVMKEILNFVLHGIEVVPTKRRGEGCQRPARSSG
jgi:AcrR family transcriptional regulator